MSQNQSYFWKTTRHNVYLRRSAKFHLLMALTAILSFSTICLAELTADEITVPADPKITSDEQEFKNNVNANNLDELSSLNKIAISEPSKDTNTNNLSDMGFIHAFIASISVILVSELGDKTFFIAAIMAMRHPRLTVFVGAISALALMTVLSAIFGMAATIIPRVYTYYISTALFAIFGLKMLKEGYYMSPTDAQEELEEVQSDLRKREDELMRSARVKYEDAETKRKNSNSELQEPEHSAFIDASGVNHLASNSAMKHRLRKQLTNSNNNNLSGCEDDDNGDGDCSESDVFFDGNDERRTLKFHSSPALSSSVSNQNNCNNKPTEVDINNGEIVKFNKRKRFGGDSAMVHSSSAVTISTSRYSKDLNINTSTTSINSINNISNSNRLDAAGQPQVGNGNELIVGNGGELKQVGGKKRLERDVSAVLIQDPESGVVRKNTKRSAAYLASRILFQAFTMTFLAEWGDRSQLTTIILSAREDVYGVIVGGVLGHSMCTGLAVVGGRIIAQKISVRTVTIVGGVVFLVFALSALFINPNEN